MHRAFGVLFGDSACCVSPETWDWVEGIKLRTDLDVCKTNSTFNGNYVKTDVGVTEPNVSSLLHTTHYRDHLTWLEVTPERPLLKHTATRKLLLVKSWSSWPQIVASRNWTGSSTLWRLQFLLTWSTGLLSCPSERKKKCFCNSWSFYLSNWNEAMLPSSVCTFSFICE